MTHDLPQYLHRRKAEQSRTKAVIWGVLTAIALFAGITALLEGDGLYGFVLPALFGYLAKNRYEDYQYHASKAPPQ